eukprot:762167-Hanusia_phi.AAC.2
MEESIVRLPSFAELVKQEECSRRPTFHSHTVGLTSDNASLDRPCGSAAGGLEQHCSIAATTEGNRRPLHHHIGSCEEVSSTAYSNYAVDTSFAAFSMGHEI